MRRTLLTNAIWCLLLASCAALPTGTRPLAEPEERAIAAALGAWRAAGRPAGEYIELEPERARVAVLPPREVLDRCLACYPGPTCRDVHSCVYLPNRTVFESPSLLVIVSSALEPRARIAAVIHETLHALRGLVVQDLLEQGRALPGWAIQGEGGAAGDLPDRPHLDAELWGPIERDAIRRWGGPR